jgi:hypothetical protein
MQDPKGDRFADLFFQTTGVYAPQSLPAADPSYLESEFSPWKRAEEPFLYWRTEDQKAFVPEFAAAKTKVEAAWRFINARTRARKEAEKLKEEARKAEGDMAKIRQLAAENTREVIELKQVARQLPDPVAAATLRHQYMPYKFPDLIPYPKKDMLDQIMKMKNKGDTVLVSNEPEKMYYVAVLVDRTDPPLAAFHEVYRDASLGGQPEPLFSGFLQEKRAKYREAVEKQLRIAAGADPEGKFVVKDDVRKSIDGRGSGDSTEE